MDNYPKKVCDTCGIEANRLTSLEKCGREPKRMKDQKASYYRSRCDICGRKKRVTDPSAFYYPNFKLLD